MYKKFLLFIICSVSLAVVAQNTMTPELLWQLGRVSAVGVTEDQTHLVYRVGKPDMEANTINSQYFKVPLKGGEAVALEDYKSLMKNDKISPDGKYELYSKPVKVFPVRGDDYYPELTESDVSIYHSLDYRIWDTWNDGTFNHVHYRTAGTEAEGTDIMKDEPHNSPSKPFGGSDEYIWTPDGSGIVYVSKKVSGSEAVVSTNTDLYHYDLATGETTNLTADNLGYDNHPSYTKDGKLAWLRMAREGYEADKNDIIVEHNGITKNLTAQWDGTVNSFIWSNDNKNIYFTAPVGGTVQLFSVDDPGLTKKMPVVQQLTKGTFDVRGPIAQVGNKIIVSRTDMNHAAEIFSFDLKSKKWQQLTHVNDEVYNNLSLSKIEARTIKTTDGKDLFTWVIYPPEFDPNKKYPTLLYLQGGPQSALSQFYSFRWNFQVMAAQGYIVVAPNRRGMPGHGVEWNEAISGDWGGRPMQDYLDAIDALSKEPFVDEERLGAVGASFGGYSAFYLAGNHEGRFKTFISHDGVFNLKSMYGTTEELFFVNWELGGPYWLEDKNVRRAYTEFSPHTYIDRWDTPIMIIQGGRDYRVPIGQSLEAFQAAQVRGIKSKLVYFPEENHWVLQPQNGLVWQREFFKWLDETL